MTHASQFNSLKNELPPVIVLAGGLATRLRPITEKIPKSMVEVAGKPFVDHQMTYLKRQGISEVVLCVGYLSEQLVEHVGDGSRYGLKVQFSQDGETLLGTGGALKKALPLIEQDTFFVTYGDSYLRCDYRAIADSFAKKPTMLGLMTVYRNQSQWDKSNVIYQDGILKVYDKKNLSPDMLYIDYGLSMLKKQALQPWPNQQAFDLADLYTQLVQQKLMMGYEVAERFYEVGSHAGLAELNQLLSATVEQI